MRHSVINSPIPMPPPLALGPVMFDLAGLSITVDEAHRLLHPSAGGVILFSRNYADPEQLSQLIASIRAIRPNILIAVDQEGGRVQRFRSGFTRLPPASAYGRCGTGSARNPAEIAETGGWLMAMELRAFGIDFSFAPVADVDRCTSRVIGDRSFSDDTRQVMDLAGAFLRGMHRAGMAGVGKHFPGHGGVVEDSHVDLPIDTREFLAIAQRDLAPFRALVAAGLEGIMPAHVIYSSCDDSPAGFSKFWIGDVLRQDLRFDGVVFSDDLSMAGAGFAGDLSARAITALAAGCDMILVCNASGDVDTVLESVGGKYPPPLSQRLQIMRGSTPVDRAALTASPAWREASFLIDRLNDDPVS